MKCPKCGKTLPEGKLFCENCGEEINIVPDYDPDSDISIDLGNVFDHTKEIDTREIKKQKSAKTPNQVKVRKDSVIEYDDEDEFDDEDHSYFDSDETIGLSDTKELIFNMIAYWKKSVFSKIVMISGLLIILIAIIGVVFVINSFREKNSYDYIKSQADSLFMSKNYEEAIKYYEKAIQKGGNASEIKYNIADCYLNDGQDENAVFIYMEIADEFPELTDDCYDKIFSIYYDKQDYEGINNVLSTCGKPEIQKKFEQYLCKAPEFVNESGSYEESIYLEFNTFSNGYIYYTTDGSDPDDSCNLYTEPVLLEAGEFEIKAVFITEKGVKSDVSQALYSIKSNAPLSPMVSIESGSYNTPINITVSSDLNCTTYYVCYRANVREEDRVDPDTTSNEYSTPLVMPMGPSEFRFISYNADGVPSAVITRKYNVSIPDATVSLVDAANIATEYRISLGGVTDNDGHVSTANGKFEWIIEDAVRIREKTYYVINEYYVDTSNSGKRMLTGLRYAVNINNPADYGSLEQNVNGDFYVLKQQTQSEEY